MENYFAARKVLALLKITKIHCVGEEVEKNFSSGSQKLLTSPVRSEMKYNCLTAYPHCDAMREDY
jgi:hypothetical protein